MKQISNDGICEMRAIAILEMMNNCLTRIDIIA